MICFDNYRCLSLSEERVNVCFAYSKLLHGTITLHLHIFTPFWLNKTSVIVKMFPLSFHMFICAFHLEISSFFHKSFLSLFLFCVICTSILYLSMRSIYIFCCHVQSFMQNILLCRKTGMDILFLFPIVQTHLWTKYIIVKSLVLYSNTFICYNIKCWNSENYVNLHSS